MKRQIITDRIFLKQKSIIATPEEVITLIKDLEDTLDIKRGIGLSAIQIGIPKNVAIIRLESTKIDLINAYVIERTEKFRMKLEGCLSLPCLYMDTIRYNRITINNNGNLQDYNGILAVAVQHELDHSNGLTILDRKWRAR
jgi:peptide deformylase